MPEANTPVLVGCGQIVQKEKDVEKAKSPLDLMTQAAVLAADDTTLGGDLRDEIDTVACVRFVIDSPGSRDFPFGKYTNLPKSLANRLNTSPERTVYGPTGGNSPQFIVNWMAEQIAEGKSELALIAGVECFGTMMRALGQGKTLDWGDDPGGERIDLGKEKPGNTEVETKHKLQFPVNAYPLFENAIRGALGRSIDEHQKELGKLMAPFTKVAAMHPQAWFPIERSADEIATPTDDNRYVGFPYTKYMNAIMQVDQAGALVMMSVSKARELGVPEEKWVYLHGCADANDIWWLSERVNFHSSPAIRTMGREAFKMAGWTIGEVDHIDLYSCFPSAVQIGRQELGIAEDDPRPLTVTGGLPYFGGAGNDYVMHSIATMMEKLRADPGSKGLVTANGYYVTKHSIGLYSTAPVEGPWKRKDPAAYQKEIDAEPHPEMVERPQGEGTIETFTVVHDREGPQFALIMGRLDEGDGRFVATSDDPATMRDLMENDGLGRSIAVTTEDGGQQRFELL